MSDRYVVEVPDQPVVPIKGEEGLFPVRRIFCVGRNYAAHAEEMGHAVDREAPFYFTKSAHAICLTGSTIPYPQGTQDCHYEMEFVVALHKGGAGIAQDKALEHVFGYACGIDLTRRDLQAAAKDKRRPWDLGKDFDQAAIIAPLTRADAFGPLGDQAITLDHDGAVAQQARLSDMVWSVPELIAHLSGFYTLCPGDLIYTGTPAGVGPIHAGSVLKGRVEGLDPVEIRFG